MPPTSKYGLVIVCTVVDDFLITCADVHMPVIKNMLRRTWKITDGGPVNWYLNMRFQRDRRNGFLKIDQTNYAEVKVREFNLDQGPSPLLPM